MRQSERAPQPPGSTGAPTPKAVPVEVGRAGLQNGPDVAQPKRPAEAVTQRVHAKQVKVVLGPHDAHFHVADHRRLRSSVELIHAAIFKAGASGVKVHRSGGDTGRSEGPPERGRHRTPPPDTDRASHRDRCLRTDGGRARGSGERPPSPWPGAALHRSFARASGRLRFVSHVGQLERNEVGTPAGARTLPERFGARHPLLATHAATLSRRHRLQAERG